MPSNKGNLDLNLDLSAELWLYKEQGELLLMWLVGRQGSFVSLVLNILVAPEQMAMGWLGRGALPHVGRKEFPSIGRDVQPFVVSIAPPTSGLWPFSTEERNPKSPQMTPPIHSMPRRGGELPLPGRISNGHYGSIWNVKWLQMYLYLLFLDVLEKRFTLALQSAPALNFYRVSRYKSRSQNLEKLPFFPRLRPTQALVCPWGVSC